MKDLDKDFGDNFNKEAENQQNKDFFYQENNDIEYCKNVEEGVQECTQEPENEEKNNDKEEKTAFGKSEVYSEQGQGYRAEDKSDDRVEHQYSSYYTPPYYVPNFTVNDEKIYTEPEKKKKTKGQFWKIAFIVCLALLCLTLIFMSGVLSSIKNALANKDDSSLNMGKENMGIIQNAPQLQINTDTDSEYVPKSLPEVVSKVGNSVVEIQTSSRVSDRFYGQYVTSGAGSGVIVTQSNAAGYLLTNYHVIHNDDNSLADTITVVLTNGEEYAATEIGSDSSLDLAVLRITKKDKESFTVADFADSSKLVVGQDVVAIGNPLGELGGTVTDGIISALDRQVKIGETTMTLLQHNAAINPGNSGGALFDMMGNLIGIVNAKTSDTGIEGLGFAIPANIALSFFNRVMVIEPAIGIKVAYGRPGTTAPLGVYVVQTTNDNFSKYDRIIKINGQSISNSADYYATIDCFKKGDSVTITVQRNGATVDVTVVISE